MPGLILEMKQNEVIIINGATLRFRSKSRIEITGKARFLFGKQILTPEEAVTPGQRIYLAIQEAYICADAERPAALQNARAAIEEFKSNSSSGLARDMLDQITTLLEADQCYEALKLARNIIRHETSLPNNPDNT
jgi:flagellar protein FlbT